MTPQLVWRCDCGATHDREVAAAVWILQLATCRYYKYSCRFYQIQGAYKDNLANSA
jgi:hypothetical protein